MSSEFCRHGFAGRCIHCEAEDHETELQDRIIRLEVELRSEKQNYKGAMSALGIAYRERDRFRMLLDEMIKTIRLVLPKDAPQITTIELNEIEEMLGSIPDSRFNPEGN